MRGHYYAAEAIDPGDPVVIGEFIEDGENGDGDLRLYARPAPDRRRRDPDGFARTAAAAPEDGDFELVRVKLCTCGPVTDNVVRRRDGERWNEQLRGHPPPRGSAGVDLEGDGTGDVE